MSEGNVQRLDGWRGAGGAVDWQLRILILPTPSRRGEERAAATPRSPSGCLFWSSAVCVQDGSVD